MSRWFHLFQGAASDAVIQAGFKDLTNRYAEKHRHYHTLQHIEACLFALDQVAGQVTDILGLSLAIWFHDIVYNPKRNDNEFLSAEYARWFLEKTTLDPALITTVEHFIVLTKHPSTPLTADEKHLIDIDLLILGTQKADYDIYTSQIRKEYAFVPDMLYKTGRTKLLTALLSQRPLFHTPLFLKNYEHQARQNIKRELQQLR